MPFDLKLILLCLLSCIVFIYFKYTIFPILKCRPKKKSKLIKLKRKFFHKKMKHSDKTHDYIESMWNELK